MFKKLGIMLIIAVLLLGSFAYWIFYYHDSRSPKAKMAHNIMGQVAEEVYSDYGFRTIAITEQTNKQVKGTYELLGIDFEARKDIKKEEAREILVDITRLFLDSLNNHPEFPKYMFPYPFTHENVKVGIIAVDKQGNDQYHPNLCVFKLRNGILSYRTQTPETLKTYQYHTSETETYEEALQILGKK